MSKRYYWLKLNKNFFDSSEIKVLQSMENGSDYIILWQRLLLSSLDYTTETKKIGLLAFKENIPWDIDLMISVFGFSKELINTALKTFQKLGMITLTDSGEIWANDMQQMIGSESDSAERVRKHREKLKQIEHKPLQCNTDVTNSNTEIDIEIDTEKEKEKKKELPQAKTPLMKVEKEYFELFKNEFGEDADYNFPGGRKLINKYLKTHTEEKIIDLLRIWFYCKIGEWHGYRFINLHKDWNRLLIIYNSLQMHMLTEEIYTKWAGNIRGLNERDNKTFEVPEYDGWRKKEIKRRFEELSVYA